MHSAYRILLSLLISSLAFSPLAAFAQTPGLSSFGGRVISVAPCISPLGPAILTTIRSSKLSDLGLTKNYIWTPATITKMSGPPSHPGQEILGLADIPYACWNPFKGGLFGLFTFLKYSYGQRMTLVGTSAI